MSIEELNVFEENLESKMRENILMVFYGGVYNGVKLNLKYLVYFLSSLLIVFDD